MIRIGRPYIETKHTVCRLIVDITMETETQKWWFEVPAEYKEYLCTERSDAFLIGILPLAMRFYEDITLDAPVTEELLFNIESELIPSLANSSKNLYPCKIFAETEAALVNEKAWGVGTGNSLGVDSFHAIEMALKSKCESFKLTHLCHYNVGAFNDTYSTAGEDQVRNDCLRNAKAVAEEYHLPMLIANSNYEEIVDINHLFVNTYANLYAVYCLQKLWKTYYLASSEFGFLRFQLEDNDMYDSAHYDLLTVNCLSTRGLRIYSEGGERNRLEKIRDIVDSRVAQNHLHVCVRESYNCGKCHKCKKTLVAIDALGKLDNFRNVFDLEEYEKNRVFYLQEICEWHIANPLDYNEPSFQLLKHRMPQEIREKYGSILDEGKQKYEPGIRYVDGVLTYINPEGYKAEEGWVRENGKRYYCMGDGELVVGNFHQIDVSWYFFDLDGSMQRGLKQIGNDKYYFGKDGSLRRGLQKVGGEMYHFDEAGRGSGIGWIHVGKKDYYSCGQGKLMIGSACIEGIKYEFDTDGALLK
ncbi:MAG: hypothetical protein PUJ55_11440 [Clostridiales bacterium]|nr:hypothetical protein [Roseburia sp.]MDD7637535.1 hypothetical protein [Clostridiales bacterium]MDY4111182.1 hypothetical protein [Roseburia sp.]